MSAGTVQMVYGPSGAGKTTFSMALAERSPESDLSSRLALQVSQARRLAFDESVQFPSQTGRR